MLYDCIILIFFNQKHKITLESLFQNLSYSHSAKIRTTIAQRQTKRTIKSKHIAMYIFNS